MKHVIGRRMRHFLIAGTRITAVFAAVFLVMVFLESYIRIDAEKWRYQYLVSPFERQQEGYENSEVFNRILYDQISEITRMCVIRNQLETNGIYNGKKKIDISAYANRMTAVSEEGEVTAEYYLDDLIKWGNYGFNYSDEAGGMQILVPRYKSVEGKDLISYANSQEDYEILVRNLQIAAESLFQNYTEYMDYMKKYESGQTNIVYCYRIVTDGQTAYYTNLKQNISKLSTDDITALFSGYQKFIAYNPDKMQITTNTKLNAADMRRGILAYKYSFQDNSRIWIGIENGFPYQDILAEGKLQYGHNTPFFWAALAGTAICALLNAVAVIFLTLTEGKKKEGDNVVICLKKGDHIPLEIFILLFGVSCIAAFLGFVYFSKYLARGPFDDVIGISLAALYALVWNVVFLAFYLCFIRKVRARTVFCDSLTAILGKKICKGFLETYDNGQLVSRTWLPYLLFLALNLVLVLLGIYGIIAAFVFDMAVGVIRYKLNKERKMITDAIDQIKSGDFSYKVDIRHTHGENLYLANSVNSIGSSIQEAVEKSMKDERLKADLITNVSHDIKTPLTSIINYVDLIKREQIDNPKIQNYIQVLDLKSQRLKQLTDDLVEASKISSGNISLQFERLNFVELINQSCGEFSEKFDEKELTVISDLPEKPVYIMADSRHIYRVIENLYNNIYKYALEGTRVYLNMSFDDREAEKKVTLTVKNISKQPLNIHAEELTERFIRGDVSRGTEGSGLGLSIAKNLTLALNGTFRIDLDGDLFKVLLTFPCSES